MRTKERPKREPKKKAQSAQPAPTAGTIAGTYVYDEALGKVVKVSDRIPRVSAKGRGGEAGEAGPCGRSECGGGTCAATGESFD